MNKYEYAAIVIHLISYSLSCTAANRNVSVKRLSQTRKSALFKCGHLNSNFTITIRRCTRLSYAAAVLSLTSLSKALVKIVKTTVIPLLIIFVKKTNLKLTIKKKKIYSKKSSNLIDSNQD